MNMLMPRESVETIVANRNATIQIFEEALEKIGEADEALTKAQVMWKRASGDSSHSIPGQYDAGQEVKAFYDALKMPDPEGYMTVARRLIDISVWSHIVALTDLESLMDKQAKEQLRDQMRYIPERRNAYGEIINEEEMAKMMPEVTVENVYATLEKFQAEAQMIFRRGVANIFSKLDRRFRSHDGFKFGNRIILSHAFDENGRWSWGRRMNEDLYDIERALQVIDGQSPRTTAGSIVYRVDQERSSSWKPQQSEHEGEFFKIRIFKNGNAHLWFTRKDLLTKLNKILAEWYGEVIGDGNDAEEDVFANRKTTPARNFGFFPTPDELADRVIEESLLYRRDNEPALKVLEPSAGTGQLALRALEKGAKVDCVEVQPHLAQALKKVGPFYRIYHADFLELKPSVTGLYDRVIMNPPFDLERDIDHVTHALDFLNEDGTLIAIMSAGTCFRETKKAIKFRELMEKMGGKFRDNPAGSFSLVGTNVNTCILRVHKDGRSQGWW